MFIGRTRELATLNKAYASNKFEFIVIYGRRRVGKTALIKEFIKDKPAIYFMGTEGTARQNLENLSKCIYAQKTDIYSEIVFSSLQNALEDVFQTAENEKLILVMDEYPYIARSDSSLASTLQLLIDKYKDNSQLILILCGSSMSYMEDKVLAYKAPLYGRRTAQIKLQPFSFAETCQCLPHYSNIDKALAYGILGGTPQYILQFKEQLSIEENLKSTFLNPDSMLYEEPENLLKQEVREPAIYNAIIAAIANGASRMTDIAAKVGESTSVCTPYLKSMLNLGILKKETPYGDDSNRKAVYTISDNMFRFWYRFIPQNASLIAIGGRDIVYQQIEPFFSEYMGKVFEEICKQYLYQQLLNGKCPVLFSSLGSWWGNNPQTKSQMELDIIGQQDSHTALLGECKWTNAAVDTNVLKTLIDRSQHFHYQNSYFYLFSKNGFTQSCIDKANDMGNVTLVTFEEMMELFIQ